MAVRRLVAGLTAALLCCLASGTASASPAAGVSVTTVVSGLDNPRGLTFGRHGRLYVAEAGHGGTHCIEGGPEGTACFGFTSAISKINIGRQHARQIVTGIVSAASPDGSGATGVDGVSWRRHHIFGIITGAPQQVPPDAFGPNFGSRVRAQLGQLIKASTDGSWRPIAGVGARDFRWAGNHPNLVPGQFPDANPYGVLAVKRGSWVVDAGANTLDRVKHGVVDVRQFFPNPAATDAVPTCIDRGPDRALYIGELTGGGNVPGSSVVWRYNPRTQRLSSWATGLTAVTGCGFSGGEFYATEFSTNGLDNAAPSTGAVVQVPAHSTAPVTVVDGLNFPGGFASRRHSLYVSNWSIQPASANGGGEVLRIQLGG
jgi:hypothetical protein